MISHHTPKILPPIDDSNEKFKQALFIAEQTDDHLFLTGRAGTGKTYWLRYLVAVSDKNMAILAPTGVAAVNAEGRTIHSFFGLDLTPYLPNDQRLQTPAQLKAKGIERQNETPFGIFENLRYNEDRIVLINKLDRIVIDEVSMVRCDILDAIDQILRVYRKSPKPFGGIQMIFIGDMFQLPPVMNKQDQNILSHFYKGQFFFNSKLLENCPFLLKKIELQKIYRQNDPEFIKGLNAIRKGFISLQGINWFNLRYSKTFEFSTDLPSIYLANTNKKVSAENVRRLAKIDLPKTEYRGKSLGKFDTGSVLSPTVLKLKIGAQVMVTKNHEVQHCVNGTLGIVEELRPEGITIRLKDGKRVSVNEASWENIMYTFNSESQTIEKKVIGTFTQMPLMLAFAITVHKSQGLTFSHVIADLSGAFACGQVYVALSRCQTLEGLVFRTCLSGADIRVHPRVIAWDQGMVA